jgi:flavin-binding protein dodecin
VVEGELRLPRFIVLAARIRNHHSQVGQHHCAGKKHPPGPAWNKNREDDACGPDTHGDEVPASSGGLLHTQPTLGSRDGEDLRGLTAHSATVRPLTQMRSSGSRGVRFHAMGSRTYGLTEVVGTSPEGIDAAIRNAVERASQTVRHLDWFEVTDIRGYIKDGSVDHVQVTMKIGFRLEDV